MVVQFVKQEQLEQEKILNLTKSDWMEIEKQRGISVTSSVMQFEYDDKINFNYGYTRSQRFWRGYLSHINIS